MNDVAVGDFRVEGGVVRLASKSRAMSGRSLRLTEAMASASSLE